MTDDIERTYGRLTFDEYRIDDDGNEQVLRTIIVHRLSPTSQEDIKFEVEEETEEINADYMRHVRTTGDKFLNFKVDRVRMMRAVEDELYRVVLTQEGQEFFGGR